MGICRYHTSVISLLYIPHNELLHNKVSPDIKQTIYPGSGTACHITEKLHNERRVPIKKATPGDHSELTGAIVLWPASQNGLRTVKTGGL